MSPYRTPAEMPPKDPEPHVKWFMRPWALWFTKWVPGVCQALIWTLLATKDCGR